MADDVWLRDLDGTGSMHVCAEGDPGAVHYRPADDDGADSGLSKRDRETIGRAINYAIGDRESFADAYGNRGPEAKEALADVVRFEKLHVKLLGRPSARAAFAAMVAAGKSVSIHDLHAPEPHPQLYCTLGL